MGNQKSKLPTHQEEEENQLNQNITPVQIQENKQVEKIPLSQRSESKQNEENQKMFSEEKTVKTEFFKSRPKMGELKVKKVKELRKTNKQNEDGQEIQHLPNLTIKTFVNEDIIESSNLNELKNESKSLNVIPSKILRTNESQARAKKYRISKML